MPGGASKSFGIEVAQLAGIPKEIINRAKGILKKLETTNLNKAVLDTSQLKIEEEKKLLETKKFATICKEIKNCDINNITPLIAFDILCNLHKKIKDED